MNQILHIENRKTKRTYYVIFIACVILFLLFFSYLYVYMYKLHKKEDFAKYLSNNMNISRLYNSNKRYKTSKSYNTSNSDTQFIIGIIEIDSIKLNYPILSYATPKSLEIAPCRFAGPDPNNIGNLCIAGHNYADNSFFGRISMLEIGDEIKIYDLNGKMVKYHVYYKGKVTSRDFSCTSQNTNGKRMITLMTCASLKNERIIVLAQEQY